MAIARTANGQIVERRDGVDIASIAAHKAAALGWKDLVEVGSGPTQSIDETDTTITLTRSELPLAEIKAELVGKLDADAESVRLKYVTPGAAMAMTYQEKHAQARAVIALGETAANALTEAERDDQFPTLAASVGLEAVTLWGCAQLVVARYEAFADLSGVIERTRLQGKKSISEASDVAGARTAYAGITWTV